MSNDFKITQKHYNTIVDQGIKNLPEESGGFLGGSNHVITAILPIFNQHLYNRTDTFAFTPEDVIVAYRFFEKHNLTYYGLYHTHPIGAAYPSQADINSGQQYHFILSLKDQNNPVFSAFKIENKQPIPLQMTIIPDKDFYSINLQDPVNTINTAPPLPIVFDRPMNPEEEVSFLNKQIGDILNEKPKNYPLLRPKDDSSGFSTLA
jgi:proteasome lid subunit RPN8/RPN11